jgi:hypothetical protein
MGRVDISYISDSRVEHHSVEDLPELLALTRFAGQPDYAASAAMW